MPRKAHSLEALQVHQRFDAWGSMRPGDHPGAAPPESFYLFSISAALLRALTGIQRRTATGPRAEQMAIQRRHDPKRSAEIGRYIRRGVMLSKSTSEGLSTASQDALLMPGYLPTAIVVNILAPNDKRHRNKKVNAADLISVVEGNPHATISLPTSDLKWQPTKDGLFPIEVIDGQHRLWAFDDTTLPDDFELPVVAFYGLAMRWQAYLFWTINIKPTRINPSLAYDLYPLMRTERWLSITEDVKTYRETRAQELVEAIWSHKSSPFFDKVNMLGEPGQKVPTQAAWVRALITTFIRKWSGRGVTIGGLYGGEDDEEDLVLPWSRAEQAAVLIFILRSFFDAAIAERPVWLRSLAKPSNPLSADTLFNEYSLIRQDQGIRPLLHTFNDLLFLSETSLELADLFVENDADAAATDGDAIQKSLKTISTSDLGTYIREICRIIVMYDWRSSTYPKLNAVQRRKKQALRGSGGYKVLRADLATLINKDAHSSILKAASAKLNRALH